MAPECEHPPHCAAKAPGTLNLTNAHIEDILT
jgi:hypothetical protein